MYGRCEGIAAGFVCADGAAAGGTGDGYGLWPCLLEYVGPEYREGGDAGYLLCAGVPVDPTEEGKAR